MVEGRGSKLKVPTHVDSMLLAPETGTAVIFEAKVLSDLSTKADFDLTRSQLARIIDVALEPDAGRHPLPSRIPDRTHVVMLTPETLSQAYPSRRRTESASWVAPAGLHGLAEPPASAASAPPRPGGARRHQLAHRVGDVGGLHTVLPAPARGWRTGHAIAMDEAD